MGNPVNISGKNNTVQIHSTVKIEGGGSITIVGDNNSLILAKDVRIFGGNIRLKGNNIKLHIDENVELRGVLCSLFMGCGLSIAKNCTFGRGEFTIAEGCSVEIGEDCMIAHDWEIRTSDMHPIYDRKTGERLNLGKNIKLGNHIWTGRHVYILKGVSLADNVVVGMNSVVTKSIDTPNCIIVGSPAKIVGENIVWGRFMYHQKMFDDPALTKYYTDTQ